MKIIAQNIGETVTYIFIGASIVAGGVLYCGGPIFIILNAVSVYWGFNEEWGHYIKGFAIIIGLLSGLMSLIDFVKFDPYAPPSSNGILTEYLFNVPYKKRVIYGICGMGVGLTICLFGFLWLEPHVGLGLGILVGVLGFMINVLALVSIDGIL